MVRCFALVCVALRCPLLPRLHFTRSPASTHHRTAEQRPGEIWIGRDRTPSPPMGGIHRRGAQVRRLAKYNQRRRHRQCDCVYGLRTMACV